MRDLLLNRLYLGQTLRKKLQMLVEGAKHKGELDIEKVQALIVVKQLEPAFAEEDDYKKRQNKGADAPLDKESVKRIKKAVSYETLSFVYYFQTFYRFTDKPKLSGRS